MKRHCYCATQGYAEEGSFECVLAAAIATAAEEAAAGVRKGRVFWRSFLGGLWPVSLSQHHQGRRAKEAEALSQRAKRALLSS